MPAAQVYVYGPVNIFVSTGVAGAFEFLGRVEGAVRPSFRGHYADVACDLAGETMPIDRQYFGAGAMVGFELKQYHGPVLARLLAFMPGETAGSGSAGSIGTLLGLEGKAIQLLLKCPYPVLKAVMSTAALPAMRFARATLEGAVEVPLSTRANAVRLNFDCFPIVATDGSWLLWDQDVTGAAAVTVD